MMRAVETHTFIAYAVKVICCLDAPSLPPVMTELNFYAIPSSK